MPLLLHDLPPELITTIVSYTLDPYDLKASITPFRMVSHKLRQFTDDFEYFWSCLVETQLESGHQLHLWLDELENRTIRQNGDISARVDNDFITIVNGWIDRLIECDMDNMLLRFLVRLAIGSDNLQHFGVLRVSVCVQ